MFLDWISFGQHLTLGMLFVRLAAAVVIGGIIGIDRAKKNRPAGIRTHVLVCVGAALVAMVEQETIAYVLALGASNINVSVGRLTSTIVSGVGFLGAGTIIMSEHKIFGLTTAASLWCSACIGLAVGAGFVTMALIAGVVVVLVLRLLQKVVHVNTYKKLEVQFIHRTETLEFLQACFKEMGVTVLDVDFHAKAQPEGNLYTNVYTLTIPNSTNYAEIIAKLSEHKNVRAVITRSV